MKAEIKRLGMNGEGVFNIEDGKDKGKVAFVDFALPNEIVDCDIIEVHSKFCKCKMNTIEKNSKERVIPKCKFFGVCGGCDIMHFSDNLQIDFKKKKIIDTLSRIFPNVKDIKIIQEDKYNYRNKMVFPFEYLNETINIGMYKKNSHELVDIDYCFLANENINKVLKFSKEYFSNMASDFIKIKHKVILKYLVVRVIENKILIAIVVNNKYDFKDYYMYLKKYFENLGVSIVVSKNNNEILDGEYIEEYGNNSISLKEFGIDYNINIMSFMQVNDKIRNKLYTRVLEFINKDDEVIDAFSGAGLMSAIVSKKAKKVVGLEINKFASKLANDLSLKNNILNMENVCCDANIYFEKYCKSMPNSTAILDPARNGCGKNLIEFLSSNSKFLPKRIVYVSCNLATLQRDLKLICNNYNVNFVCGFDMFAQSSHIETLVVLNRRDIDNEKN